MGINLFRDMLAVVSGRKPHSVPRGSIGDIHDTAVDDPAITAIINLSHELLSRKGEASGAGLARQWLDAYRALPADKQTQFFTRLSLTFEPDRSRLERAWKAYEATGAPATISELFRAAEPPRQELFRRLNRIEGGTGALVAMRSDMLGLRERDAAIDSLEGDLAHLLQSWFNRGFLVMQQISWASPAETLERIIRYEAVHAIRGWDDLRRRTEPADRRCYGFFHPALLDDPLIFVEVALTREVPTSIQELLSDNRSPLAIDAATTAVFYSISNCQPGLKGISFGNFLIKQVVEQLKRDLPALKTFVTLSPVPGFARWRRRVLGDDGAIAATSPELRQFNAIVDSDKPGGLADADHLRTYATGLCAHYLTAVKDRHGRPADAVARFHLGNGARLERINWLGDTSEKGLSEAHGMMVNYLYDLAHIEANHEAFENDGKVVVSRSVGRQATASGATIGKDV